MCVCIQRAPHGITAKVADFGLSREMHCRSRVETRTCGTITHMPPELLSSDVVSKVRVQSHQPLLHCWSCPVLRCSLYGSP